MTQYLDLVALGTYADVAVLDYNNRILVDAGVKRIQQHQCRVGILALLDIAGREATSIRAQDLGLCSDRALMLLDVWRVCVLGSVFIS